MYSLSQTKRNSKLFLVILLGILSAFAPFILDLYLPSFPNLVRYFSSDQSTVQLTLSAGMIGVAIGQMLWGTLSDKYGRRIPLLCSLLVFVISTVFIVFSPNIQFLIAMRFIQGLAASGSIVIARAVVSDLYKGQELVHFFGLIMAINGVAPIISPILGSVLLSYTDWRGSFVLLALLGVGVFVGCLFLKESLPSNKRTRLPVLSSFTPFKEIVQNKKFMLYTCFQASLFGCLFAYISASPFIFQEYYKLSSTLFAVCFASNGIALIMGTSLGGRKKSAFSLFWGIRGVTVMVLLEALVLLTRGNVWLVELGFVGILFCIGVMLPALSAQAMGAERRYAGGASALFGFSSFIVGGLVSPLVGIGNIFIALSTILIVCVIFTNICYVMHRRIWMCRRQSC